MKVCVPRPLLLLLPLLAGCASGVHGDDPTPSDTPPPPEAALDSIWYQSLPDTRPYTFNRVLGGGVYVRGHYDAEDWSLSFAPGGTASPDAGQVITSALNGGSATGEVDFQWSSLDYGASAAAGSDPESDDLFTLMLSARNSYDENGELMPIETTDSVQLKLDNTPPIALITRVCTDEANTKCFGFSTNPADFGAENTSDELLRIDQSSAPKLYVYGVALDKNFDNYTLYMLGGQATRETWLCSGAADSTSCLGSTGVSKGDFGYGSARDMGYQPTLARDTMIDAYSDDTLLAVWDISYLTPDAYALGLGVVTKAFVDGNDDPLTGQHWITFVIDP